MIHYPYNKALVLDELTAKEFTLAQHRKRSSQEFIAHSKTSRKFRLPRKNKKTSSANKKALQNLDLIISGRSFTYRINKRGPRTDPWGTPQQRESKPDSATLATAN